VFQISPKSSSVNDGPENSKGKTLHTKK